MPASSPATRRSVALPARMTGGLLALVASMTLLPDNAVLAAPRHAAHKAPITTDTTLPSPQTETHPRSLESQEGAQPLPDGYTPVEDFDETLSARYPLSIRETPHGSPLPSIEAQQIPRDANNGATQFNFFGVPTRFIAPVAAPYNSSFTYHTYAGQSGRGQDAVGGASAAGEP
ncbi:hypothetical protein [Acetobacter estunensis]|uniref:hypothetical protein n=1 Tax=Acetobacter estunensis TaxID=104097 RepID=UPI0020C32794|nr:hypothetical protein [Acetobacter estunensis]